MDQQKVFARFLISMAVTVVVCCLLVIACVVVIDPYRLYQLVQLPGFSQLRPALQHDQEEIKLTLARKAQANVFILGNSRAELGLDPADLRDQGQGWVPFNLAISGSGTATARSELAYLQQLAVRPRVLILGLDFLDFLVDGSARSAPSVPADQGYRVERLKWKFTTLFSLDSLDDVLSTLRVQHGAALPVMSADGFNPMLDYTYYARQQGYYAIFRQRAEEYARSFVHKPHDLVFADRGSSPAFDDLHAMIAMAAQQEAQLQLVIYPYHAQMLAMFEQVGLWPAFEAWKQLLAQQVAQAQHDTPGLRIALWDFSGFSSYQCEPIPAKGDLHGSTRWYWEAGHFKKALGDLMIARMQTQSASADFGWRLTPANLASNQQRIADERAACVAANPATFAEAAELVAQARQARQVAPPL